MRDDSPGRLVLGICGRRKVAAEAGQSVLVVGPTQSGKTMGLALPALLEWKGPIVATSVKTDLLRSSLGWRAGRGTVWVFDPTASTGIPTARWSPLDSAATWAGARRTADALAEVAQVSAGSFADSAFWYALASKLLAPLMLAASACSGSMTDVVRWLDEQEVDEVEDVLHEAGEWAALRAARASWGRDERQRSAVYTTAETVLEAFADPDAGRWSGGAPQGRIDASTLLDGDNTLYLCASAHDQRRLRPVFATLVGQVVEAAFTQASRRGSPIDPPLLVLLDEAANVAPVAELDTLASTAAGHGVQLVTVWQDLAQLGARYGQRAGTVVNNHHVKMFLSGISDLATLEHASALAGETLTPVLATTRDGQGGSSRTSTTSTPTAHRLLPTDAVRRTRPGMAIVVAGHLPPFKVALRPWPDDRRLAARAATPHPPFTDGASAGADGG
jgi:type IV secretion system protein VirD4